MTDIFGISSAVQGVTEIYFRGARRTGRTHALLGSVKSGDTVVFQTVQQVSRFEVACRERGIERIRTMVLPVSSPEAVFDRPMTEGRLIFDHVWLEEHYRIEIQKIAQRLGHIATQASGYSDPHHVTCRQAEERARWLP